MRFITPHSFVVKPLALGLAVACLLAAAPLRAEDGGDPFQLSTGHWISFDHYKEKTRNDPSASAMPAATPAETPAASAAADAKTGAPQIDTATLAPETASGALGQPAIAAPTRPIDLPVLPGLNKGYRMPVTSTAEDDKSLAQITNLATTPTVQLPASNWQNAASAAKSEAADEQQEEAGIDPDHPPLKVRFAFLPNGQITPVPTPEYKSNHGRAALHQSKPKPAVKSPTELAACAAIDAYKKKQLEAIQGDRETLAALQKAISQMGLQKQLNFMTGASNDLADNAPPTATNVKMDMPAAPAAPAKN